MKNKSKQSKQKIKWFKYRQKYSYGTEKVWTYDFIILEVNEKFGPKSLKEYISHFPLDDWSEHFRGFECSLLRHPPKNILLDKIKSVQNNIKYTKNKLLLLSEELKKLPQGK